MASIRGINVNRKTIRKLPFDVISDYTKTDSVDYVGGVGRSKTEAGPEGGRQNEANVESLRRSVKAIRNIQRSLCWNKEVPWLPDMPANAGILAAAFSILDDPSRSKLGKRVGSFMLFFIMMSITSFVLSTLKTFRSHDEDRSQTDFFRYVEMMTVWIFFIEYVARFIFVAYVPSHYLRLVGYEVPSIVRSNCRCLSTSVLQTAAKQLTWIFSIMNLLDFISVLPLFFIYRGDNVSELFLIRIMRLTRVFRLIRFGNLRQDLWWFQVTVRKSTHVIAVLFILILGSSLVFSMLIYYAERGTYNSELGYYERIDKFGSGKERSPFGSVAVSMWWVVCTATGVGYGDMYPTTGTGMVIGGICMYVGILGLALPLATIAMNLVQSKSAIDEEKRIMLLKCKPWNDESSPQQVLHDANEIIAITDHLIKLNRSMRFWASKSTITGTADDSKQTSPHPSSSRHRRRSSLQVRGSFDGLRSARASIGARNRPSPGPSRMAHSQANLPSLSLDWDSASQRKNSLDRRRSGSADLPRTSVNPLSAETGTSPLSSRNPSRRHGSKRPLLKKRPSFMAAWTSFVGGGTPTRRRRLHKRQPSQEVMLIRRKIIGLSRPSSRAQRSPHLGETRNLPSMLRLSEQSELLSAFLSIVLTRSRVLLLSCLLQKQQKDHRVNMWDYITFQCLRTKKEQSTRRKSLRRSMREQGITESPGLGWTYRTQESELALRLVTSRCIASLSNQARSSLYRTAVNQPASTATYSKSSDSVKTDSRSDGKTASYHVRKTSGETVREGTVARDLAVSRPAPAVIEMTRPGLPGLGRIKSI